MPTHQPTPQSAHTPPLTPPRPPHSAGGPESTGAPGLTHTSTLSLAAVGLDRLRATEWVLTDGLGGFAMGTGSGIPSRRYHGLLVASLTPPVQRELLLHSMVETLLVAPGTAGERRYELSSFRFAGGTESPRGIDRLVRFECDTSARWTYACDGITVVRTLRLVRGGSAAVVSYHVETGGEMVCLEVRPMVPLRDAHELHRFAQGEKEFSVEHQGRRALVSRRGRALELTSDGGFFEPVRQWWYNFQYDIETQRGLDDVEDIFSPGAFVLQCRPGQRVVNLSISATLLTPLSRLAAGRRTAGAAPAGGSGVAWNADDQPAQRARLRTLAETALTQVRPATPAGDRAMIARLVAASDAFVVERATAAAEAGRGPAGVSIIAGYPWFTDWGRDSMISLNGLLLATRRFDEARRLLETFASHMKNGLVPNLFDDQTGEEWYNTVDASLWYLHAASEYLRLTGDRAGFDAKIRPACLAILDAYSKGTSGEGHGTTFRIAMDPADALIAAGDDTTQLTWMDAKRDGVVFTPRHGKAVEINALWYHGLLCVSEAIASSDPTRSAELASLASRVGESFRRTFWNAAAGCCFDVIVPKSEKTKSGKVSTVWTADPKIRPNQIFAASLRHSPLTETQRAAVVRTVQAHLLTPLGLRTLSPSDPGYKPRFRGRMMERDAAYHNGTVWPWLMGAYIEALLRVNGFSEAVRAQARQDLDGLVRQLDEGASLGQIYEVFDGDGTIPDPRQPGGCMAQAWSVAETLRAMLLIHAGS